MPTRVITFTLLLLTSLAAYTQTPPLTGKYEGFADAQGLGKLNVTAEIRERGGTISGVVRTPLGDAQIIKGSLGRGTLSITVDAGGDDLVLDGKIAADGSMVGTLTGKVNGNPIQGTFELRRFGDLPADIDQPPVTTQSKEKWREDLRFLAAELPKRHKNAFNHLTKQQWEAMVADLHARIPELSDDKIIIELDRIGSSIGDGHTGIVWTRHFPRLPLRFFWFGNELRVTQVSKEYPQLRGARVTQINGVEVAKIYQLSRAYIPQHESEEYVLDTSAFQMTYPVFLAAVGAGAGQGTTRLDYVDSAGKKGSVSMSTAGANVEWLSAYAVAPLYLQQLDKDLNFEYLKDTKTVYVNFKRYPRRAEFQKFSDELFAFIDKNNVDKIVVDFRHNGGGDFTRGRDYFVKPIKQRKKFLERGRLFAIIGRRTFSAGMSNAADFRNDLGAILVGEPSGARPNGYQENRSMTLPNSHITVSYSVEFYKFSDKDTPGIIPDKLIRPDWKAYVVGRDPVLEWILAQKVGR